MMAHEQRAVRNVGILVTLRALQIAGGLVFAAVVPRLMGPKGYGQVSLLVALSMWFTTAAGLGFTEVIGRHIPRLAQEGRSDELCRLLGRLLAIRVLAGLITAGAYLLVMTSWLRDLDATALALLALAAWLRAPSGLFFSLQLGLNRAHRWSVAEIVRQWGYMLFMLPGYLLWDARGAAAGVLLMELTVFAVGFVGARPYLSWSGFRLDFRGLAGILRFGLLFYASDLVIMGFERSGDVLLRWFSSDYAEVGFFNVTTSAYAIAATAIPNVALAFLPLLTVLRLEGQDLALRQWIERLLKWLAVASMVTILAAALLGDDLVGLILGHAYRPVGPALLVLTTALIGMSLTGVAHLGAVVFDRPTVALSSAAVRLAVFWILGWVLVRRFGNLGACLSAVGALLAQAAFFTGSMRRVARYSLRQWALVVGVGCLFLPLRWLRASLWIDVLLLVGTIAGYAGLLFLFRVLSVDELRSMKRALRIKTPADTVAREGLCVSP